MATHESHKLLLDALVSMQALVKGAKVPPCVEKCMAVFVTSAKNWVKAQVDCGLCGEMMHKENLLLHLEEKHSASVVQTETDTTHPGDSMTVWVAAPEGVLQLAFVCPELPERTVYAFLERTEGMGIIISTSGPPAHVLNVSACTRCFGAIVAS